MLIENLPAAFTFRGSLGTFSGKEPGASLVSLLQRNPDPPPRFWTNWKALKVECVARPALGRRIVKLIVAVLARIW